MDAIWIIVEQSGTFNEIIAFFLSLVCFGVDYLQGQKAMDSKK